LARASKGRGLGTTASRLLMLVAAEPGVSVSEAALKLGLAKSTVSETSRLLELRGLIRRVRRGPLVLLYPSTAIGGQGAGGGGEASRKTLTLGVVRASEYLFLPHFIKLLREHGVVVRVRVYDNGIEATHDLADGRIDLAISPLLTQLLFYALTDSFKVIGGGAYGGAFVIRLGVETGIAYTTKASTMELCLNVSGVDVGERVYASSGREIYEAALRGKASVVALWEPYASLLKSSVKSTVREIVSCSELGIVNCCTLAAHRSLASLYTLLSSLYARALEEYSRRPWAMIAWYSRVMGLNEDLVKKTASSYVLNPTVNEKAAARLLEKAGFYSSMLSEALRKALRVEDAS